MSKTLMLLQDTLTRRNDNTIQANYLSDCLASNRSTSSDTAVLTSDSVSHPRNSVFPLVFCDVADQLAMRYAPEVFQSTNEV